ncbi:MAG: hypothetical protein M0R77_04855 [Gammaproteobacteria bacterium]|nr:hypothetical protein [Gammaproteobacteria bacterium]
MRVRQFRFSDMALGLISLALVAFILALLSAAGASAEHWTANRQIVSTLGLTDLCIVTEARYTRHLSQADGHAAFQDHPMALEHFPSGAILSPPPHLRTHAPLDR